MRKTFIHIIILLVTFGVGFAIGYFNSRKRMLEKLEENRQGYAKELSIQDSLIQNNILQLHQYQEKVVSLDKQLRVLGKQVGRERIIYETIEPMRTSNQVVESLKRIVNEEN